jgi:hypothetical protein
MSCADALSGDNISRIIECNILSCSHFEPLGYISESQLEVSVNGQGWASGVAA